MVTGTCAGNRTTCGGTMGHDRTERRTVPCFRCQALTAHTDIDCAVCPRCALLETRERLLEAATVTAETLEARGLDAGLTWQLVRTLESEVAALDVEHPEPVADEPETYDDFDLTRGVF